MRTAPSADEPAGDLPSGTVVGEYRIERKLKQGGMGTVYEAVHQVIHKRAAVKVLKRELCENDETVHRFVQEARAVNRIGHPNIVDVFGFGVTHDGRSFLAMELLVGETLGERFMSGPVRRSEACDIVAEITHALDAAHACGIIHRDLKPDNVFLAEARGGLIVKLLDFGIAKLTGGGGLVGPVEVTQPGTVIGTPKYIAPEQARGLPIDGSADVYALGVILFELLVGRAPFIGDDPVELLAKHVALDPPLPRDLDPTLPPAADTLLGEMLDKNPAARPSLARVRQLIAEIRAAPEVQTSVAVAAGPATTIISAGDQRAPQAPRRSWRRWWLVPGVLAVIALGVRGAVWIADRNAQRAAAPVDAAAVTARPTVTPIDPPPASPSPAPQQITPPPAPVTPPPEPVTPPPEPVEPAASTAVASKPTHSKRPVRPKPAHAPTAAPKPPPSEPKPPAPVPPADDDALRDPFR